ncbi:hypothetical protein ACJX0J_008105 [Zea mays]
MVIALFENYSVSGYHHILLYSLVFGCYSLFAFLSGILIIWSILELKTELAALEDENRDFGYSSSRQSRRIQYNLDASVPGRSGVFKLGLNFVPVPKTVVALLHLHTSFLLVKTVVKYHKSKNDSSLVA